ncbi:hypothetical protein FQN57_006452 [Myotisia sp. PD_48]|nr:hypothetical protein FQN57_006452 [Myotisia sp. PD_48]
MRRMIAHTKMVIVTPARVKNVPMFESLGSTLLANSTIKQHSQVQMIKLTKMCQACTSRSGWKSIYIDTVIFAMIADMDAVANIHARQFQNPANQPTGRPCRPAAAVAQWYTVDEIYPISLAIKSRIYYLQMKHWYLPPAEEGIADASSARDAATKK